MGKPKGRMVKRTGMNGFGPWRGVSRQGDAGSLSADQFWTLENMRWANGTLYARGGQEKLNSSVLAGGELINGIYDSSYGGSGVGGVGGGGGGGSASGAGSIPAASGSCPGPQPTTGDGIKFYSLRSTTASAGPPYSYSMMFYDDEKYPSDAGGGVADNVFGIPSHATTDPMYGLATALENIAYAGKVFQFMLASSGSTVRVGLLAPCFGDVRPPSSWVFDQTLSGGAGGCKVGGFSIWNGKLYYVLFPGGTTPGVTPRLYYYDGTQSVEALNPALVGIPAAAVVSSACASYAGHMWMGFGNCHIAANTYYPQKIVNELGTVVAVGAVKFGIGKGYTVNSGTYTARQSMVEFNGKLYLGGQRETPEGPAIYSYDSAGTVAVARDLSGVGPTPAGQWTLSGVYTMWVWGGYLWFLYNTRFASADAWKLGKFDGTTWTNDVSATGLVGYTRQADYKGAVILYGDASLMLRATDGITFTAFGTRPGGGNPNSCSVAELAEVGAVL